MISYSKESRAEESVPRRRARLEEVAIQQKNKRISETAGQRNARVAQNKNRRHAAVLNSARSCDVQDFDEDHARTLMSKHYAGNFNDTTCEHCHAYVWKEEPKSMCCASGKVVLHPLPPPPTCLQKYYDVSLSGRSFLDKIRSYNNIFALASLGCNEAPCVGFNPTFKIQGKMCHRIGSLLPPSEGDTPKFAQLYFHDSDHELQNRLKHVDYLDQAIVQEFQDALHESNSYIESFKAALELTADQPNLKIVLHAGKQYKPNDAHCRTYNLPEHSEVAAIISGEKTGNLDVIIHCRDGGLLRINEIHRSYDPLHYVLLFPYGTDGWQLGMKRTNGKTLTQADYYAYQLQVRQNDFNLIMKSRRLMQQYAVDAATKIEYSRLKWAKDNQKTIRAEKYSGLFDAVAEGDGVNAGRKVILPPTFYGSPRFYNEIFQNSMTAVRHMGKPDFFITFTTNPKWTEITEALNAGEMPRDRPDLCARVFHIKYQNLMDDLLKKHVLGKVRAHSATIEWQKRGLTHVHILLIMEVDSKPGRTDTIDKVVCCEIPDPENNPILHGIITSNNIHGPCGQANLECVCMEGRGRNAHCTKSFPKPLRNQTIVREDSYPEYRRRAPENGGRTYIVNIRRKGEYTVDNSWIVPYNPFLSLRYNAHINVEVVHSVQAVKYLYKYICKGNDKITFTVENQDGNDVQVANEIETFVNARYLSSSEAIWKTLQFKLHSRSPPVEKLPCHLPGDQMVIYEQGQEEDAVAHGQPVTKLTDYFKVNERDVTARNILYPNMPRYFTWDAKEKKWIRRKCGPKDENFQHVSDSLGRIPTISLSAHQSELYHLRMLLHQVTGAQKFKDLRTVNGQEFITFKEAAVKLGLLDDDTEKDNAMAEASSIRFGPQLREIFCTILLYCEPADTPAFWNRWKYKLAEDIMHRNQEQVMSEKTLNLVLIYLQERIEHDGLDIVHFGLPKPNPSIVEAAKVASVIREETELDFHQLQADVEVNLPTLNAEQKIVFDKVVQSVNDEAGKIFCLNASGGTGKTYTMNVILDHLRSQKKVALATAMSGIAATLLHNGRTLHSRCKVPIVIDEASTCSFSKRDATGKLMQQTDLLIVDEVTMGRHHIFECLDRSLQDVRSNNKTFGGITVLFSGDWKQILPVVPHGGRAQIIEATLKNSYLWNRVEVLNLTTNVRVASTGTTDDFSELLLTIGMGQITIETDLGPFKIRIPDELCMGSKKLDDLTSFVFEGLMNNYKDPPWLANRAVITPTNVDVEEVNNHMMSKFQGDQVTYQSSDKVEKKDILYPTEFLTSLNPSGFPHHKITLKVGCPIMLLGNLDPQNGHTNGTRYIVTHLHQHIIEAVLATGSYAGRTIFIPRILHNSQLHEFPFILTRKQFPVKVAFAMTSNKAQGQTLMRIGIYLKRNFFSHGQLYVALSRVARKENVKILSEDTFTGKEGYYTDNCVYPEIFQ